MGFGSFNTARRTLKRIRDDEHEPQGTNTGTRKRRCSSSDRIRVENFWNCCITRSNWWGYSVSRSFLQHNLFAHVTTEPTDYLCIYTYIKVINIFFVLEIVFSNRTLFARPHKIALLPECPASKKLSILS